jgi:hypothetical protein
MAKKPVKTSRDAAGIGPYARERERLVPMSEMRGWNVVDGEADIRSWEVRTVSGRVLGSVRELLIDPKAGEVVMIDVDIAGSDERAYVPLRLVEIDRSRRMVRADSADLEEHGAADSTRLTNEELSRVRQRDVNYARPSAERVIERRPIVEETVVRRRIDEPDTRP